MRSVQPVAPHLRVRANELVFLQVLQGRSQVISDPRRKYKGKSLVKLMPRELPLCKGSLKNSRGQVSGPVSDPQLAANRRRSVSPGFHETQPKTAREGPGQGLKAHTDPANGDTPPMALHPGAGGHH
jgi:hypothetical protein